MSTGNALYQRHFLRLMDFTPAELQALLRLSADLKQAKKQAGTAPAAGQNIALIFEKTRPARDALSKLPHLDQGAVVTYLGPSGSQIGHKESMKDTARVLGRLYDGIQYRGYGQALVETLAEHAGVPVWNGLTDEFHPTQLLADLLTVQEHLPGKALSEVKLAYVGDARNNMGNTLLEAAALAGHGSAAGGAEGLLAAAGAGRVPGAGAANRRETHPDRRHRRRGAGRRLPLHRRLGVDG